MPIARFARTLFAAICLLFVGPALASASLIVNTTADEPDQVPGGTCNTAAGKCSLRAAIEVSNLIGTGETIFFSEAEFQGQMADTISLSTPLPAITAPASIAAEICPTAAGVNGPCAGIDGPSGQAALKIEAGESAVMNLAITGAQTGIFLSAGPDELIAQGNWIGVKLDGSAGANGTGIFLDPESNKSRIGGVEAVQRNVISNNSVNGLQISGADKTKILGNYFGVDPAGTAAAPNGKSIEITDTTGEPAFKANDNVIGTTVEGSSYPCDHGCNLISGSAIGIDLNGNGSGLNEAPASGPTTIAGNFLGTNAAGNGPFPAATTYHILAGGADNVLIGGGGKYSGAANYISGGTYGIYAEGGADLLVQGNWIGYAASGVQVTPPSTAGIFSYAGGLPGVGDRPVFADNWIRMVEGSGLEQVFGLAKVTENFFQGGLNNILTRGSGVNGALIEKNEFTESQAAAIQLRSDENKLLGNRFVNSGGAAIEVASVNLGFGFPLVTGNLIGGLLPGQENTILLSAGNPIKVLGTEEGQNEIGRNVGEKNGGAFIDLVAAVGGEAGPAEGIQPPALTTARQNEAKGTSLPGAKVRVFRRATPDPGGISAFLGEAVASGSGEWAVAYPESIPGGALVTATQTNTLGGTSELSSTVTTVADPVVCPGGPGCPPPTPPDTTKPKVTIKKAPKAKSTSTTAKFKFVSNESGSKFKCKLDKKAFANCKSPKTYKKLKPGKHVFKVKATDAAGNVSAVVTRKFTVVE